MMRLSDMPTQDRDAMRYQWLRSKDVETVHQGGVFGGQTPENVVLSEGDLDAAIDREMIAAGKAQ